MVTPIIFLLAINCKKKNNSIWIKEGCDVTLREILHYKHCGIILAQTICNELMLGVKELLAKDAED